MSIEFVLGRTASKRDDKIIEKIGELALRDPLANILVVVPPQATYITEKQLIDKLGLKGLMGVCVQSPARICERVLESTYGKAVTGIDAAGKSMMMRLIMDRNENDLHALRKCAKKGDLPLMMGSIIAELKTLDFTPDMLRSIAADNKNTAEKFEDIAYLYERFNELSEGLYDTEDKIDMVIEHIPQAEFLKGAHLFIHGFDIYNAQTVRFLKALMEAAEETVVSFYYADGNAPDAAVYEICNENRNKFLGYAVSKGLKTSMIKEDREISEDILHIEKNLYAYPFRKAKPARDVSVTYATDLEEEIRAVAAQIAYLKEKRGYAFRDMAVVAGSSEGYAESLKTLFEEAGIPCFTGEKRTLGQSVFAQYLLSALELLKGRMKKDTLLAHAKTGLAQATLRQAEQLQNYAFSHVRDGFAFLKPFADPMADEARKEFMEPICALRDCAKEAETAGEMIRLLTAYMERTGAEEKLRRQILSAEKAGLLESAEFGTQVFEKTVRILKEAQEILKDTPVTKTQLAALLKTGLEAQQVGVIPPGADEVAIGEIAYIRPGDIRALFVVGANEGILPNYAQSSDILADHERELMLGQLAGLKFTGNVEKQKLAIVKVLTKPADKLFLSCVDDGKAKPSPVLQRIMELFEHVKTNRAADLAAMLKANAYVKVAGVLRNLADGVEAEYDASQIAAVLGDGENPEKLRAIERGLTNKNWATPLKGAVAQELYGEIRGNASRLEKYYECPYKHFVQYGIKADVPQEYTINPMDVGNFAHDILDGLQKAVKLDRRKWADIPEDEFAGMVDECTRAARETQSKFTLNRHNENVLRATAREVRLAAGAIRAQAREGMLQPAESEFWFSQEFGGVKIDGKIDRIDTAELDGMRYFDIVDYKTGEHDFDLSRFAGGVSLQLVIYIMAVMELMGGDARFAGANYFNIHLPEFERPDADVDAAYRMAGICGVDEEKAARLFGADSNGIFSLRLRVTRDGGFDANARRRQYGKEEIEAMLAFAKKLVANAAESIKDGDTAIRPYAYKSSTGCDYCDFASICMFDAGYTGNAPRVLSEEDKEETMKQIRREE